MSKKNIHHTLWISMLIVINVGFLSSCKKEALPDTVGNDGQISFFNVSAQLSNDVGYSGNAYVLTDLTDTIYKSGNLPGNNTPVFGQNEFQYPSTIFNSTLRQPWVMYMRLKTGMHQFTLVDTGHYLRVRDKFAIAPNAPVSVYYTDSLGYFRSLILQDQLINKPGIVRLRFIDLSPDAGKVFFTINEKAASSSGFVQSLKYGQSAPFVDYPNPRTDTLRINFYQAADSSTVVASAFLQAAPGRSYTLALNGYYNQSISYPDPKNGQYKSFSGFLSVLINTNN